MAEIVFHTIARLISHEEEDEDEWIIVYACHALGHIIGVLCGNSGIFQNTIKNKYPSNSRHKSFS